jgi:hypothetical protein
MFSIESKSAWVTLAMGIACAVVLGAAPASRGPLIIKLADNECSYIRSGTYQYTDDGDAVFEPGGDDGEPTSTSYDPHGCSRPTCADATACSVVPAVPPPGNHTRECDCASGDTDHCELKRHFIAGTPPTINYECAGHCGPAPTPADIVKCKDSLTDSGPYDQSLAGTVWTAKWKKFCKCP